MELQAQQWRSRYFVPIDGESVRRMVEHLFQPKQQAGAELAFIKMLLDVQRHTPWVRERQYLVTNRKRIIRVDVGEMELSKNILARWIGCTDKQARDILAGSCQIDNHGAYLRTMLRNDLDNGEVIIECFVVDDKRIHFSGSDIYFGNTGIKQSEMMDIASELCRRACAQCSCSWI